MPRRIYLASTSPRRHELLRQIGVPFEVMPSGFDEDLLDPATSAQAFVRAAAVLKAEAAAERVKNGIVLGADTVVSVDGQILGKPKDLADAARMLKLLSGRTHAVLTGVAMIDVVAGVPVSVDERHVETEVRFRKLSPETIAAYLDTGEPMDKAGAYAIQGRGAVLVEGVIGDYFNVVGLPVGVVAIMLESVGLPVL